MAILAVLSTKRCNLRCDFCINAEEMRSRDPMIENIGDVLYDYLQTHGDIYEEFVITGGEPFSDKGRLEDIISAMKSHDPNKPITISTNGCYIGPDEVATLNHWDIGCTVSIDGIFTRERGLSKVLAEDYKEGYLTLQCIRALNKKVIYFVLTRDILDNYNLAFEIFTLYQIFQCRIILVFDSRKEEMQKFNIDNLLSVTRLVYNLELLGVYDKVRFRYVLFNKCNSEHYHTFDHTGSISKRCEYGSVGNNNCGKFTNNMKPGMYEALKKIIQFNWDDDIPTVDSKPNYDPNTGYVGPRSEITPLRKNPQVGEIIPIRQVA